MPLYSNEISSFEQIRLCYPDYYCEIKEMVAIWKAAAYLVDLFRDGMNRVLDNAFITTMDEETTASVERFLGMRVDSRRTLEARRNIILSYFIGLGKISVSKITSMVEALTGGKVNVTFDRKDREGNIILDIVSNDGKIDSAIHKDIALRLGKQLPAHIAYHLAYQDNISPEFSLYVSLVLATNNKRITVPVMAVMPDKNDVSTLMCSALLPISQNKKYEIEVR